MTEKQNHFKFHDGKPIGAVIYSNDKKMTEKRFFFVIDNGKYTFDDLSENGEIMNMGETEDMLNELNDEIEQLKKRLKDKDELLNKQLSVNNNLTRTIKHYETSLNNAIDNERTSLGRSVLKQYKNNLME